VPSFVKMGSAGNHLEHGKSSTRSSKAKPLNYCLMLEGGEYKCEQDTTRTEN
jgi:hypothetical protein